MERFALQRQILSRVAQADDPAGQAVQLAVRAMLPAMLRLRPLPARHIAVEHQHQHDRVLGQRDRAVPLATGADDRAGDHLGVHQRIRPRRPALHPLQPLARASAAAREIPGDDLGLLDLRFQLGLALEVAHIGTRRGRAESARVAPRSPDPPSIPSAYFLLAPRSSLLVPLPWPGASWARSPAPLVVARTLCAPATDRRSVASLCGPSRFGVEWGQGLGRMAGLGRCQGGPRLARCVVVAHPGVAGSCCCYALAWPSCVRRARPVIPQGGCS